MTAVDLDLKSYETSVGIVALLKFGYVLNSKEAP